MYDPESVKPMREELTRHGVTELLTGSDVDKVMAQKSGTALVMVNSVCGCAAGSARPALIKALKNDIKPQRLYTVFAGVDKEATEKARSYFTGYPPSSPSFGIFRDGQLVHMIERHDIEGVDGDSLSHVIKSVFDKYCGAEVNESIRIADPMDAFEITPVDLKAALARKDLKILDCRDEHERKQANIDGSILLTREIAEDMVKNWDKDQSLVVFCHYGEQSLQAVRYFKHYGFQNVKSLRGGIQAWSKEIDQGVPQYA